jgi:D-alanyl-lipoteichoic acid acyltransferase DltB (MBOAT superfamily)
MLNKTATHLRKANNAIAADLNLSEFFNILIPLIASGLAVYLFKLEASTGLSNLMPFIIGGFAIHIVLPIRYKLPFFFSLCIVALFVILGMETSVWILALGMGLFGVTQMPVALSTKKYIILASTALIAILFLNGAFPNKVIPVLGGIFMFRMIAYLHEMQHQKQPEGIWMQLSYFFLLPNLIFFIFPVVDYKVFTSSYYRKPAYATYQKGLIWIANGLLHLFLYRIIYYYLIPAPSSITTVYDLLLFLVASYALIVRLAGIFHFSAGVICLFGFDLPPTFQHYFFAQNFSDLWRRINIYWRDFVMKVFYYPIFFKIKHIGTAPAIIVTILIVFFINWFLHGYQWFWIRGSFPLTIQDAVFWGVFGIVVAINAAMQVVRRPKRVNNQIFKFSHAAKVSLSVIGTFMFIALLWSFWTTNDIQQWSEMMLVFTTVTVRQTITILLGVLVLIAIGIGIQYLYFKTPKEASWFYWTPRVKLQFITGALLFSCLFAFPAINQRIQHALNLDMGPVLETRLNAADQENMFKGYYETLLPNQSLMGSPLEEINREKPDNWKNLSETTFYTPTNDIFLKQIKPNLDTTLKLAPFKTNSAGFRDDEFTVNPNPGNLRIALNGGSIEMGAGVPNEQIFASIVESKLNAEKPFTDLGWDTADLLNFSMPDNHMPQQIGTTDRVIPRYQPDIVIYTAHHRERLRLLRNLKILGTRNVETGYPYLQEILQELSNTPEPKQQQAQELADAVIKWGLETFRDSCQAMGAVPVWVYVPVLNRNLDLEEKDELMAMAKEVGIIALDLSEVFQNAEGVSPIDLCLAEWDRHFSPLAHGMVGEALYQAVVESEQLHSALRNLAKERNID